MSALPEPQEPAQPGADAADGRPTPQHPARIAIEPAAFKGVFRKVPTAVAIVTAMTPQGTPVGLTVGSFASVSLEPPIVSLSVMHTSSSWAVVRTLDTFGVSIVASDQADAVKAFSAVRTDRMATVDWSAGHHGLPVIHGAAAFVACRTRELITVGDHEVAFADVLDLEVLRDVDPLVFAGGSYAVPQPL